MHAWLDTDDSRSPLASVLVEQYRTPLQVRLVLLCTLESGRKGWFGDLVIVGQEAAAIGTSVITGDCPAAVLADWIEDHPEFWRQAWCGVKPPVEVATTLCQWLRRMTTISTVP